MSTSFSIYLDLIRFIAAFLVFLSHIKSAPITDHVVWKPLGMYGAEAVTIFFVLSGYVISYVTTMYEKDAKTYIKNRIARLYSVVLIALPLTFLFDQIGMLFNPEFYANQEVLWKPESWQGYLSSLFFLNEYQIFDFNGISPGTNGPYWSLSFEATYYVVAGLFLFTRQLFWIPATALIFYFAGITILALMPLWLLGFFLYRIDKMIIKSKLITYMIFISSIIILILAPKINQYLPHISQYISFPLGRGPFNREIVNDYFVAIIFSINLFSAKNIFYHHPHFFQNSTQTIRKLGKLTFPLYLLHFPTLCLIASITPFDNRSIYNVLFISVLTFLVVILLTPLSDSLKYYLRNNLFAKN